MTPTTPREIHPVHLMITVGLIVGLLTYVAGIPPIFGRPMAALAAGVTLLVYWLRHRGEETGS